MEAHGTKSPLILGTTQIKYLGNSAPSAEEKNPVVIRRIGFLPHLKVDPLEGSSRASKISGTTASKQRATTDGFKDLKKQSITPRLLAHPKQVTSLALCRMRRRLRKARSPNQGSLALLGLACALLRVKFCIKK